MVHSGELLEPRCRRWCWIGDDLDYCPLLGCTDPAAWNYNAAALNNDGSCQYNSGNVYGCTNPSALNYNSSANYDDGSCQYYTSGCTNPSALNYNSSANYDDGSCQFTNVDGCPSDQTWNGSYCETTTTTTAGASVAYVRPGIPLPGNGNISYTVLDYFYTTLGVMVYQDPGKENSLFLVPSSHDARTPMTIPLWAYEYNTGSDHTADVSFSVASTDAPSAYFATENLLYAQFGQHGASVVVDLQSNTSSVGLEWPGIIITVCNYIGDDGSCQELNPHPPTATLTLNVTSAVTGNPYVVRGNTLYINQSATYSLTLEMTLTDWESVDRSTQYDLFVQQLNGNNSPSHIFDGANRFYGSFYTQGRQAYIGSLSEGDVLEFGFTTNSSSPVNSELGLALEGNVNRLQVCGYVAFDPVNPTVGGPDVCFASYEAYMTWSCGMSQQSYDPGSNTCY